jgi:hypothetical protein
MTSGEKLSSHSVVAARVHRRAGRRSFLIRSFRMGPGCVLAAGLGLAACRSITITETSGPSDASPPPTTFNVFDQIPQFGLYVYANPAYTPPAGVLMWSYGTEFVTKLTPEQQSAIGADVAARVTYFAQCDNYDRLGDVFLVVEPAGATPQPTDPRVELVRFITPFSDYRQGALATHVYPDADLSAYAQALADSTHDVWIGIAGGSNPYGGDPCSTTLSSDFQAVGFKYSLDLVSSLALTGGISTTLGAVADVEETAVPVTGAFVNPGSPVMGHVTVIVSGHGSAVGGDEYEYTQDTVTVGGAQVGSFTTRIDCSPFARFSPDGNPGIFEDNLSANPRNWCPGSLVPSHTFAVTLPAGTTPVALGMAPSQVPSGSHFATSITFSGP